MAPATIYKWIDLYSKSNESSVSKADFLELKRQLAKVKEERDILKDVYKRQLFIMLNMSHIELVLTLLCVR